MNIILEILIFTLRFLILACVGMFLYFQMPLWGIKNGLLSQMRRLTILFSAAFFLDIARQIVTRILVISGMGVTTIGQEIMILTSQAFVVAMCIFGFLLFWKIRHSIKT